MTVEQFQIAVVAAIAALLYFSPSIWAFSQDKNSRWAILLFNVVPPLWPVAAIWAMLGRTRQDAEQMRAALEHGAVALGGYLGRKIAEEDAKQAALAAKTAAADRTS